MKKQLCAYTLVCACALLLTACGGGGSNSPSNTNPTAPPVTPPEPLKTVSGVATASTPLVGKISIRDSAGKVQTQDLQTGGSFQFDVSAMKSPFMLRASGESAGEQFVLHAAATNADGKGDFNVNPLTDLIVAKAVGQAAASYFDGGNYSNLSTASLAQQETAVQARIQPLLSAAGVPESVDLRRHLVAKDESGVIAVLHVLTINVDAAKQEAGLTNRLSGKTITEPLNQSTGSGVLDIDAEAAEVLQEMPSIASIVKQSVELDFRSQFDELTASLHPEFLDYGMNKERFLKFNDDKRKDPFWSSNDKRLRYFQVNGYKDKALAVTVTNASHSTYHKGYLLNQSVNYSFKKDNGRWLSLGGRSRSNLFKVKQYKLDKEDDACYVDCDVIKLSVGDWNLVNLTPDNIMTAIVYGPGLPDVGLVANKKYVDNGWRIEWVFDTTSMDKYTAFRLGAKSSVHIFRNNPANQQLGMWPVYKAELYDDNGLLHATEYQTVTNFEADQVVSTSK